MQGIYWKPQRATRIQRAVIAALAVMGLIAVERFPTEERQPHYREKLAAAKKAQQAFAVLREGARRKQIPLHEETDPALSGMLGPPISPITTGSGSLLSKQTSVNPNFAAVVVQWLKELDVAQNDRVAVGVSGSFPSMNVAVYAALDALKIEPIIVVSAAASQFGATDPSFTWLDMEAELRERGVFGFKAVAASRGGVGDDGIGLSKHGQELLDRAIARNDIPKIEIGDEESAVDKRMRIFREVAGDHPIKAYINVGGGTVSVGTKIGKRKFLAGINRQYSKEMDDLQSIIGEFLRLDIPAIHTTRITTLAERYGLPLAPVQTPEIGQGGVFQQQEPNRWLAGFVLLLLLSSLLATARRPWASRFLLSRPRPEPQTPPADDPLKPQENRAASAPPVERAADRHPEP